MSPEVDPAVSVDVGLSYVSHVLAPFRMPDDANGKPFFNSRSIQTVERLVDLFGPDIKEQQISPLEFPQVVVGCAALKGVHLTNPTNPNLFLMFSSQARTHLDAYYESMDHEEGPVPKFY